MDREYKLLNDVVDSSLAHPILAGAILVLLILGWFAGFIASVVRLLNQDYLDPTGPTRENEVDKPRRIARASQARSTT